MESGGQDTTTISFIRIRSYLLWEVSELWRPQVVRSPCLETRKSEVCLPPLDFSSLMYLCKKFENIYVHNYWGAWGLTFQQLTDIVKHLAYANFCPLSGVFSQTSSLDGVYSVSFHLDIEPRNFHYFNWRNPLIAKHISSHMYLSQLKI